MATARPEDVGGWHPDALRSWRVDAGVFNLGDASYYEWADVRGRPASDPLLELYRRPGRNWRLALTANW